MSPEVKRDRLTAIRDGLDESRRLVECGHYALCSEEDRVSEAVRELLWLIAGRLGDTVQALERDLSEIAA